MSLDTTIGGAATDSYVDVTTADAYFLAKNVPSASWSGLAAAVKEAALRKATQYLDAMYFYKGFKYSKAQRLLWPRSDILVDGYYVDPTGYPRRLTDACCELAFKSLSVDIFADLGPQLVTKETVGPISTDYSPNQRGGGRTQFDLVDMLLRPLLGAGARGSIGVERA
jgi:hypothetical protein